MLVVVIPTHWTVASIKSVSLLSLWDIASPDVRKINFYIFFNQPGSVALSILILLIMVALPFSDYVAKVSLFG